MGNQWSEIPEELEVTIKIKGLGLKKYQNSTTHSDETPDVADPADISCCINQGLVEFQSKDSNSPLYSVKTFEALHLKPELLKGVYAMGFISPSRIQATVLPALLANPPRNLIAQFQSGSCTTTTTAFVLAMLSRVDAFKNYPQVLCLSPTYELAIQTGEVAATMAKLCPEIKLKYAVRGEEVPRGTKINDHIIIGTPGKMLDWGVKFGMFDMSKIKVFVIDEADVIIDNPGHRNQCIHILQCLPTTCQIMFFFRTYSTAEIEFSKIIPNPIIVRLPREEKLDNIKQYYVKCKSPEKKYRAICSIYGVITIGQAIIFCHMRQTASWLSEKMSKDGHSVAVLSGELSVEQRITVLDRYKAGLEKVLITTNVLSPGIDVGEVTLVVNFDMPKDRKIEADCETYLHRIGRTGRFGKAGIAINLVDSKEAMDFCMKMEGHFDKKIHLLDIEDAQEVEKIGA